MPAAANEFVTHCLDLLAPVARCTARRMFGGWGLSTDGLTMAIIADLGGGERLWLKTNDTTRTAFEATGCVRFTYLAQGQPRSMGYHSAPDEAMESAALMRPWAALALDAALHAQAAKATKATKATKAVRVTESRPGSKNKP